jgi:hypothetical protein
MLKTGPLTPPPPTLQTHQNGQILLFSLASPTRADLDDITSAVVQQVAAWDAQKPWLVLYDVSRGQVTPYARDRLRYIGDSIPMHFYGRTAIQLPDVVIANIFKHLIKTIVPVQNSRMLRQFFTQREAAVQWLEAGLG